MKTGFISAIDDRTGAVTIRMNNNLMITAAYFSGAVEGAPVVFEIGLEEDTTPYAKNIYIIATSFQTLVLEKLNQLQNDVDRLLKFELPEEFFDSAS